MLGLARRAGRLSMGHDMAEKAVKSHKACMLLLCSDVSPRLAHEFEKTVENSRRDIPVLLTDITMDEIHFAVGYRAGVMTVDDENFCKKIISLLRQEEQVNGH